MTGASLGELAEGGNAAGAYLAGACRIARPVAPRAATPGQTRAQMLQQPLPAYMLFGGVEPWADALEPGGARRRWRRRELVVAITPYVSEEMKRVAHVLLPIGTFAETSGTYVNLEGLLAELRPAPRAPLGEARPGWKVLRVLGNVLELERVRIPDLRGGARRAARASAREAPAAGLPRRRAVAAAAGAGGAAEHGVDVPMYQIDAVVRRAPSLQRTARGRAARRDLLNGRPRCECARIL